jgi:hypothetical protein
MRLVNDSLARILHDTLYQRMLKFCNKYTPEFPGESIVTAWLQRLYSGDNNLHILVSLDSQYKVTGHCVIDVMDAYGYKVVWCHQAMADKGNKTTVQEGLEYIDKLVIETNSVAAIFAVTNHIKGLSKYGYTVTRTMMMKSAYLDNGDNDES